MTDVKYRAFISYSHSDRGWAKWLQKSLENYRLPKHLARDNHTSGYPLRPVFRDEEVLAAAPELTERIQQALAESENLIVVCSPQAHASSWVDAEIRAFRALGKGRVFALLVESHPGHPSSSSFPPALTESGHEPLAADVTGAMGKHDAFLKLAAGILNIEFAELRQRELRNRNRRLLGASFISTVGMVFAIALAWFAIHSRNQAEQQAAMAEQARSESDAVTSFLADMLAAANPGIENKDVMVREVLDKAAEEIDRGLATQPLVEARLRGTIGDTYKALGLYAEAERQQYLRLEILNSLEAADAAGRLDALGALAWLKLEQARYDEAVALAQEVLTLRREAFGPEHPDTLNALSQLGNAYVSRGRFDEAESALQDALMLRRKRFGDEHLDTAESLGHLGRLYWNAGELARARPLLQQAFDIERRLQGEVHPDTLVAMGNLTAVMRQLGEDDAAIAVRRRMLEIQRRTLGDDHPHTLITMTNLAVALADTGDAQEAEALLQETISAHTRLSGAEHPRTLYATHNLATVYMDLDDIDRSVAVHRRNVPVMRRVFGMENAWTLNGTAALAVALCKQGEHEEAETLFVEFETIAPSVLGEHSPQLLVYRHRHGKCLFDEENYEQAELLMLSAHADLSRTLGKDHRYSREAASSLVGLYEEWGKTAEAERFRTKPGT